MGEASKRKKAGLYPDTSKPKWNYGRAWSALVEAVRAGRAGTPADPLSDKAASFIATLVPGGVPVRLPFTNVSPAYKSGYCQMNVNHRVLNEGGERVDGWMIWESPAFVDAESHAVWRDADGNLIDLTPRADNEPEILFLPDPTARVERITLNGVDTDRMLCNRTSMSDCPYTKFGQPVEGPFRDETYTEEERRLMKSVFGVETAAST